jgi:hypothetical protein
MDLEVLAITNRHSQSIAPAIAPAAITARGPAHPCG